MQRMAVVHPPSVNKTLYQKWIGVKDPDAASQRKSWSCIRVCMHEHACFCESPSHT